MVDSPTYVNQRCFYNPSLLLDSSHMNRDGTPMSHPSQASISEVIGIATGICPQADSEQINRIVAWVESSHATKIQEKLVQRLEKPRVYGLLCINKTLYLIAILLQTVSHGAFHEYWIKNCGLFDRTYLQDTTDQDEIQTCENIKNILNEIKKILKQMNNGRDLVDTLPPIYHSTVMAITGGQDAGLSFSRDVSGARPGSSQNDANRQRASHLSPAPALNTLLRSPQSSSSTRSSGTTSTIVIENNAERTRFAHLSTANGSIPSQNNQATEISNTGIVTPQSSPNTVNNKALLKNFLSPNSRTSKLPNTNQASQSQGNVMTGDRVSTNGTPTSPTPRLLTPLSNPFRQLPLVRDPYVPGKSGDVTETIDNADVVSEVSTIKPKEKGKEKGKEKEKGKGKGKGKVRQPAEAKSKGTVEHEMAPGEQQLPNATEDEDAHTASVVLTAGKDDLPGIPLFQESVWDITDCVQYIGSKHVAKGGYADVWKGIYTRTGGEQEFVAIKKPRKEDHPGNDTMKLYQEVHTWQKLSHRNIVPFYGICAHIDGLYGMVSPYYFNGHVIQYLEKTKADPIKPLYEISKGIKYLHSNGIIHGDLKGANVLIHPDGHACLTDFGLAQVYDEEMLALGRFKSNMGTSIRWSAPEMLKPASETRISKTFKSDIYSFACTAVEMMTLKVPYPHLDDYSSLSRKICSGEYPKRPQSPYYEPTDGLWMLLRRCWYGRAEERPAIREVINELRLYVPKAMLRDSDARGT